MAEERPRLRIKPQKEDKILEITGWLLLSATWVLVLFSFKNLPEKIPSHFDFMGEISGWAAKSRIFFLPAVSTFLLLLITYLNFRPHQLNYPTNIDTDNAYSNYFVAIRLNRWVKILIAIIFLGISFRTIQMAHGHSGEIGFWTLPILVVLILIPMTTLLIYLLKRKRRNETRE